MQGMEFESMRIAATGLKSVSLNHSDNLAQLRYISVI